MVSVHLALGQVTESMGPTGFCPGTHITGQDFTGHSITTESAGPAGPLELRFALEAIAIKNGVESCVPVVAKNIPTGTVTIYDSAVQHRGMPNRADRHRILLNLNIGSSQSAIEEENYGGYFKSRASAPAVNGHLSWLRNSFGVDFYEKLFDSIGKETLTVSDGAPFLVSKRLENLITE